MNRITIIVDGKLISMEIPALINAELFADKKKTEPKTYARVRVTVGEFTAFVNCTLLSNKNGIAEIELLEPALSYPAHKVLRLPIENIL